ncbi:hypothetical protein AMS62_20330 [Bacillus sp. FJAT-18019]|nr:hypothetical protein AMS62_20330 [Bacillus sp. FJAT-18019]
MSDISSVIKMIDNAALQQDFKEIEKLIKILDISDQHELHSLLNKKTIEVITEHRGKINIASSVKEHIIWFHFDKLSWSEEMLDQLINIYKEEHYLALESRVISAMKSDEIDVSQIDKLECVFSSLEFKKQIENWKKRNSLA